jgi:23S rRNA pseudouridine1911/1915/1917 synthase
MSTQAPRGRPAETSYDVTEVFDGAALLRVRIHTGRTHQIRVHLSSVGHPVVGDATYAGRRPPAAKRAEARAALAAFPRQALHAASLAFTHPADGLPRRFESPLPADIARLLESLRGNRPSTG